MAKENKNLVICGKCKNCTPITEPEKCSVAGEPILALALTGLNQRAVCFLGHTYVFIIRTRL